MRPAAALIILSLLAGCGGDAAAPSDAASTTINIPDAVGESDIDAPGAASDNSAAIAKAAPAIGSARAAAGVARDYFDRLASGDASGAQLLWDSDAAGERALLDRLPAFGTFAADIGEPGAIEAGAGQRYVDVPFRIASTAPEAPTPLRGRLTLHRVAEIDGATPTQLRWQIRSVAFADRPAATDAPPAAVTARYRCIDGSRLVADFDNVEGTLALARDGEAIGVLAQQPAASGIWYRGGGYDLRGKGDEATFTAPGLPPLACTAD